MRMLKKGDTGQDVVKLQQLLNLKADGIFGEKTRAAVVNYQLYHELFPDGVVGNATWTLLLSKTGFAEAIDKDTDLSVSYKSNNYDQLIHQYYMPKNEYVSENVPKEYVVLHHTAGDDNPYSTIDIWAKDTRGRIGTEFVLGGQDHTTSASKYDGEMVQAFPTGNNAWHIGNSGSGYMNRRAVGLEICSMGYLDAKFKTYKKSTAAPEQVITLDSPFRGFVNWHRYSDNQIDAISKWLRFIGERDGVDLKVGLYQWIKKDGPKKAFEFQEDAYYGKVKGLLSHTNIRRDKMDVYPDPRLIDVIMSL